MALREAETTVPPTNTPSIKTTTNPTGASFGAEKNCRNCSLQLRGTGTGVRLSCWILETNLLREAEMKPGRGSRALPADVNQVAISSCPRSSSANSG